MKLPAVPAVIVHGADHARAAVGCGRPVVLLSAPGAGCYGGARWWRLVVEAASRAGPGLVAADVLDCGAEAGRAVEALREGCCLVVLDPNCRAFADVRGRAEALGAQLLPAPPPALDLGLKATFRRLPSWLAGAWLDGNGGPG